MFEICPHQSQFLHSSNFASLYYQALQLGALLEGHYQAPLAGGDWTPQPIRELLLR